MTAFLAQSTDSPGERAVFVEARDAAERVALPKIRCGEKVICNMLCHSATHIGQLAMERQDGAADGRSTGKGMARRAGLLRFVTARQ
jgi:hypothetical protein